MNLQSLTLVGACIGLILSPSYAHAASRTGTPRTVPVEIKIEELKGPGDTAVFAVASFKNGTDKTICVPHFAWPKHAEAIEALFDVYSDEQSNSLSQDELIYEGLIVERNIPEDDYRLVPPGGMLVSTFPVSRNFQFAHGKHRYHFTLRIFAPYCEALTTKLLRLPTPLFTNSSEGGLNEFTDKGVLLTSKQVDFVYDEARIRVRFVVGEELGGNATTYALEGALHDKFLESRVFAVDMTGRSATPIIKIPSVIPTAGADGRSRLNYYSEISTADGKVLGRFEDSCWTDEMSKCAEQVLTHFLSLRDRM